MAPQCLKPISVMRRIPYVFFSKSIFWGHLKIKFSSEGLIGRQHPVENGMRCQTNRYGELVASSGVREVEKCIR